MSSLSAWDSHSMGKLSSPRNCPSTLPLTRFPLAAPPASQNQILLRRRQSPVERQYLARDKRPSFRAEEDHRADQVINLGDAAQRNPPDEVEAECFVGQKALHLGRAYEGRGDRVDGDCVFCPLGGVLPGQGVERTLGGDIGRVAGIDAQLTSHRGYVQDPASTARFDHRPGGGLRWKQRRLQVQVDYAVPLAGRIALGRIQSTTR